MRKKNNGERERVLDLTRHVEFLRDVIKILKAEVDPLFAVYTCGPWHSVPWTDEGRTLGLSTVRTFEGNTGGYPRGVLVREGTIFILIHPAVVDDIPLDDSDESGIPLCLIEKKRDEFKFTPALLLADVKGKRWEEAWRITTERWKEKGKNVPDFCPFLEND